MLQRFFVSQQRARGDRHLYALRSRFIPEPLLEKFELLQPMAVAAVAPATVEEAAPLLDLAAALRAGWPAGEGRAAPPKAADRGQNPP